MIILLDADKTFDKIQHPFMIRVIERSGIQGLYLNIIKAIQSKPVANIKLNGEKLEAIPIKSGTRQAAHFLLTYSIQYLKSQPEIKGIKIGKEEVKISLLAEYMILYISDPKNSTRELLNLINSFGEVAKYKINSNKSMPFSTQRINRLRKKLGKQHPSQQSQII